MTELSETKGNYLVSAMGNLKQGIEADLPSPCGKVYQQVRRLALTNADKFAIDFQSTSYFHSLMAESWIYDEKDTRLRLYFFLNFIHEKNTIEESISIGNNFHGEYPFYRLDVIRGLTAHEYFERSKKVCEALSLDERLRAIMLAEFTDKLGEFAYFSDNYAETKIPAVKALKILGEIKKFDLPESLKIAPTLQDLLDEITRTSNASSEYCKP